MVSCCNQDRFEGFPYIITRIVPALYHIILVPGEYPTERLYEILRKQAGANRLDTCLALDARMGFYIDMDGKGYLSELPPIGGNVVINRLKPCQEFPQTDDYRKRSSDLDKYESKKRSERGFMLGDLSCGSRDPTRDELKLLVGKQKSGMPEGLSRCDVCGQWRGQCIRRDPEKKNKIFRICCDCENDNRCAKCGALLYEKKLNSNYYDADGKFWHVPGFMCLNHVCR